MMIGAVTGELQPEPVTRMPPDLLAEPLHAPERAADRLVIVIALEGIRDRARAIFFLVLADHRQDHARGSRDVPAGACERAREMERGIMTRAGLMSAQQGGGGQLLHGEQ